jgi:hypothetical protein
MVSKIRNMLHDKPTAYNKQLYPPTKTAMVCKLAHIHLAIWMPLPLEAKKWLLKEQKRHQQEDDKLKKSCNLNRPKDTSKLLGGDNTHSSSDSNLPNKYIKVKHAVKQEDEMQDQTASSLALLMNSLKLLLKVLIYMKKTKHKSDSEMWNSDHYLILQDCAGYQERYSRIIQPHWTCLLRESFGEVSHGMKAYSIPGIPGFETYHSPILRCNHICGRLQ